MTTSPSFSKMATVTGAVKRTGYSGGTETGLGVVYASVPCLPLDPLDPETRERLGIDTPNDTLRTTVDGAFVILKGDTFTVAGKDYPVRAVRAFSYRNGTTFRELILEELLR